MMVTPVGLRATAKSKQGRSLVGRMALVSALGLGLSACAAAQFERISSDRNPDVEIGLSQEQIELRVKADALSRTPWKAPAGSSANFSVTTLFSILVDGVQEQLSGEDAAPEADDRPEVSAEALAYLEQLETEKPELWERLDLIETHLSKRTTITREFLSAASLVAADLRLEAPNREALARRKEDRRLISATLDRLRQQRQAFDEVSNVLGQEAEARGLSLAGLTGALVGFSREIDALDILARSLSSQRLG